MKFVQRGSYTDYFAAKMAALKAQGKFTDIPSWTEAKPNPRNLGLGADKVDTKVSEVKVTEPINEQAAVEKKKKSKKKKKEREDAQDEIVAEESVLTVKKKSKKNRKEKLDFESIEDNSEAAEEIVKKKKKSKKNKRIEAEEVYEYTETLVETEVTK